MDVSHVMITMSPNGELLKFNNRGRPNAEKKTILSCPRKLKAELKKLKKEMSFNEGTEILLALSLATDDMARHFHMFPEVLFMDVTGKINRQNRDLFLAVVKDASGECCIGNATLIPSQQRWVFHHIYKICFLALYGEVTVSRIRLFLTDDDISEHSPLDSLILTDACFKLSKHMLCMFHAIVMGFAEYVYPYLNKSRGKRKLTKKAEVYGKFCVLIVQLTNIDKHHNG